MTANSRRAGLAAAFVLAGISLAGVSVANPAPRITSTLTAPFPPPYNEAADAGAEVTAAIARAQADHKFVLLDFGGNWCPDCRITAAALELPEVKPWLDKNFAVVKIDIGRLNKNLDIGDRYNVHVKAVPTIIILDRQGRMINAGNPAALKDARTMSAQAIVDTINDWIEKPS
jgi:thiol-disulfide isomerase/thioredoxin